MVVRHNDGKGRFSDVTAEVGLASPRASIGCAVGDFDADGLPDLYITAIGGNVLLRNNGQGGFEDVTEQAGVAEADKISLTALFLDIDHDGDLDLLVANYGPLSDADKMFRDEPYTGGAANSLYVNVGPARLVDAGHDKPPLEARLVDGWFQWQPKRAAVPQLVLGNSGAAGEWRICADGHCRTLSEIFERPIGANVTVMSACEP